MRCERSSKPVQCAVENTSSVRRWRKIPHGKVDVVVPCCNYGCPCVPALPRLWPGLSLYQHC
jgi:hypothetical protein